MAKPVAPWIQGDSVSEHGERGSIWTISCPRASNPRQNIPPGKRVPLRKHESYTSKSRQRLTCRDPKCFVALFCNREAKCTPLYMYPLNWHRTSQGQFKIHLNHPRVTCCTPGTEEFSDRNIISSWIIFTTFCMGKHHPTSQVAFLIPRWKTSVAPPRHPIKWLHIL